MTNQNPTCGFALRGYIRESVVPQKNRKKFSKTNNQGDDRLGDKKISGVSNNPLPKKIPTKK